HAPGLERDLPARLAAVEVGVAEAHHQGGVEEQARGHGGAGLGIVARAAEDDVQEHQDEQQPVDLGHGARDAAQLLLLEGGGRRVARRVGRFRLQGFDLRCHSRSCNGYYLTANGSLPWNIPRRECASWSPPAPPASAARSCARSWSTAPKCTSATSIRTP